MWQNNSTNIQRSNGTSISPNLLKNFNPYELLLPEKVNEPALLIDLRETNVNDTFSNNYIKPKTSSQTDTIDYYQDIYATPSLETPKKTIEVNKNETEQQIDWTRISNDDIGKNTNSNKGASALEFDALIADNVKELNIDSVKLEDDNETNPEDLIEEVLICKAWEKIYLSDVNAREQLSNIKVLKPPMVIKNVQADTLNQMKAGDYYKSEISIAKDGGVNLFSNSSSTLAGNSRSEIPSQKEVQPNITLIDTKYKSTTNIPSSFNRLPETDSLKRLDGNVKSNSAFDLTSLKDFLIDLNRNTFPENTPLPNSKLDVIDTPITPSILSELPLQTMVKEPKSIAKKLISISDTEKFKFTKGPTFKEKTLVLPQLLLRLDKQKKEYEAENSLEKRLILDPGAMKSPVISHTTVELNPTVLKENCNKDRLIAYRTRLAFQKLTENEESP